MKQTSTSIACTLNDSDMQNRLKIIHEKILSQVIDSVELEHGQQLSFLGGNALRADIETFIELEKQCCAFLNFDLSESKADNQLILRITGPGGTKEFLTEVLS